jgi:predicted ATPase with chaperone activity
MTDFIRSALFVGAVCLSVNLSALVAWGADAAPKQGGATAESSNVSDKELRAFAKAYVEYQRIRQSYEPKMNNTRDEKEKLKIQREGDDKVKQALEKQGLTPQGYNRLFAAVNGNPQLRQKALTLIDEERKKS